MMTQNEVDQHNNAVRHLALNRCADFKKRPIPKGMGFLTETCGITHFMTHEGTPDWKPGVRTVVLYMADGQVNSFQDLIRT